MTYPQELFNYVRRPNDSYRWEEQGRDGRTAELRLRSQVWQDIEWNHRLSVAVPSTLEASDLALLYVTGSDWGTRETTAPQLAESTGIVSATLYDVPNQPLFGMLIEDALIAHTFVQYLSTGEADWPLLLPMVKSVTRAMDALQEFLRTALGQRVERFVVMGASKRGWTTWLTAIVDERVAGIVPMVFDNLNLSAQMPHQVETMGRFSESIADYTEMNLPQQMATPEGQRLAAIVDPYTYRERLALPKLIVNGTNDSYWATDALNLYWHDLPGSKSVLYVPNSGHFLEDGERVFRTAAAFVQATARGETLPVLEAAGEASHGVSRITLKSGEEAKRARLWVAHAINAAFHTEAWYETDLTRHDGLSFTGYITLSKSRFTAVFGEVDFERNSLRYTLSTPILIEAGDNPATP